ncbi:hypothetical protein [Sinorhizobium fredii]|uniref:hypothetical protein n=1 Tax=Rhizobium fredii TaxID=380 RepID=UPI0012FE7028|nr:hypothetical protein [Sinorhizobium fredii]
MDNYPHHIAPTVNEGGGIETPFEEWWPKAQIVFPNVPEEVARYWLHEHWGHSPYSYLKSLEYQFERQTWPSDELWLVRSTWNNYAADNAGCFRHGEHLIENVGKRLPYRTPVYMMEHGDFPTPIIVLDNRDGHLPATHGVPPAYLLIEGHRRFNMALYLQKKGRLAPTVTVWLMMKAQA